MLTSGVMHACVTNGVDYVLAGSIRDDGPLPDVITDSVRRRTRCARESRGVGLAIMVATTLHSVATGQPAARVGADHLRGQQHRHDDEAHGSRHAPGVRAGDGLPVLPERAGGAAALRERIRTTDYGLQTTDYRGICAAIVG